ncbi:MAG: hypothetical protein ABSG50_06195 [Opitutaceae bacterium]
MKTLSSKDMYLIQGGYAPALPDPPFPDPSNEARDIMRYFMNLAMRALITHHPGIAE